MGMQSQKTSNGVNKTIKNLILFFMLLVVLGLIGYYFWPKDMATPTKTLADYLEFKIVNPDFEDWQITAYQEEFAAVKASLEDNQDQLEGWVWLGSLKKTVGDYQGAEEAWLKAGEIRPYNSTSFGNLSDLYANFTKEYDKVEPALRTAIENSLGEEKNVYFYRNLYDFYRFQLEDNQGAKDVLLEAIQNNSKSAELYVLLAQFYQEQGDKQEAITNYQKALELNPDSQSIKRDLDELQSGL